MNSDYRTFFGFEKEPFRADLQITEILETDELMAIRNRVDYAIRLGGIGLVTGDIGSGKSTSLRYSAAQMHPSEYHCFYVIASSGSILELYKKIMVELGINKTSNSSAVMTRLISTEIRELVMVKKMKVVLVIDEASLLCLEVFTELHTICQFCQDSKPWLPIILAGQSNLIDKLMYRASAPLASRVITRSHMEGVNLDGMREYLLHHLNLVGVKTNLFEDSAITAIHQGSGGLFRKANHLARGALIAAANKKCMRASAEHVRLASTEIF